LKSGCIIIRITYLALVGVYEQMTANDIKRNAQNLALAQALRVSREESAEAALGELGRDPYVSKIPARTQHEVDRKIEKGDLDEYGYVGGHLRAVTGITHTVGKTEYIIHVTATTLNAVTIILPDAQAIATRRLYIKDGGGNSSVNNITVETEGVKTIDGSNTYTINIDYGGIGIYSDGSNWFIY